MQIDVAAQLGAVTRGVRAIEKDGKAARVVTAAQTYSTSAEDLWNAVTSAERIPRWFLPVTGDLRRGGRYQLQGNAGGEILVCDAPAHLAVTWEFAGQVSWLDVRIEPLAADSARLTLEHTMYEDDHWKQFGAGATGVGWDMAIAGLARHLETGIPNDPAEGMAWMMSDEGKAFSRQSSDNWCAAAVAAGEDPATARARAAKTVAAYTGATA